MSPPRKPRKPAPAEGARRTKAEPQEPASEAYPYADPDAGHIGPGATGNLDGYQQCPLCFAYGGGGHGSNCPNAGKDPADWATALPDGWTGPERTTV